jgi:ATP-binding cassette subfamily C (CFTR/MRP) protein 4
MELFSFGPGIFGFVVFFLVCVATSLMQLANSFLLT